MSTYYYTKSDELMHFGVLGMKWGRRKGGSGSGGSAKKAARKELANTKSSKTAGVLNSANSAARRHYTIQNLERKAGKTHDFQKYRQLQAKASKNKEINARREAGLTEKQIKAGRYRISRNRNYRRIAASALVGGAAGAALVASGAGLVAAAASLPAAAITYGGTNGVRYAKEQHYYGKYANA